MTHSKQNVEELVNSTNVLVFAEENYRGDDGKKYRYSVTNNKTGVADIFSTLKEVRLFLYEWVRDKNKQEDKADEEETIDLGILHDTINYEWVKDACKSDIQDLSERARDQVFNDYYDSI